MKPIHRSAQKVDSPKLNFRFTEFCEVRLGACERWPMFTSSYGLIQCSQRFGGEREEV